jgi:hypothetical protein
MAKLRRGATEIVLRHYELVGQGQFCSIFLDDEHVSGEHARIHWDGRVWIIKDLGSKNRTFVGGLALEPGGRKTLACGGRLAFGNPEDVWTVEDLAPPEAPVVVANPVTEDGQPLTSDDGPPVYAVGGLLGLPSHETPLLTVYRTNDGAWTAEGRSEPLTDQAVLRVEDGRVVDGHRRFFRISVPRLFVETKPLIGFEGRSIAELHLLFLVSSNFEHIELEVSCGELRRNLGAQRHNEVLYILARARAEQVAAGGDHDRSGWIHQDDVCKRVGDIDRERLNTEVYRARRQFAELGFINPAQIIERRARVGELRLGPARFEERRVA